VGQRRNAVAKHRRVFWQGGLAKTTGTTETAEAIETAEATEATETTETAETAETAETVEATETAEATEATEAARPPGQAGGLPDISRWLTRVPQFIRMAKKLSEESGFLSGRVS
jgi:hypothetical protein